MSKKILITGMNKLQCTLDFFQSQQLKVVPSHYSLVRCLRDGLGYEVEQRHVEVGESLDEYDEVIVYIHNPSGFAGYVYNALWAVHARPNCILAFDDWQTDSIYNGLLALEDPAKLFRAYVKDGHKNVPEDVEKYQPEFISALQTIASKKNRMLISAFAGGDPLLLIDGYNRDRVFTYNPNPYNLHRKPENFQLFGSTKRREFNFAGLVQDKTKKWLKAQEVAKTNWLLNMYGSRKDGQDRVTEPEMVEIYAEQWCALMAGYFHAGSGWWRARPTQLADAGSILIGEPKELMILYGDQELSNKRALDIVDWTDSQLAEFAAAQKDAIYKNHPLDKDVQCAELLACLESVK